jgi:Domain of unknown function DUF11
MIKSHRRTFCILASAVAVGASLAAASAVPAGAATTPTPPFTECPAIGSSPSCEILLVVNADNTVSVLGDPSVGPYDGSDDTLVGIINDSTAAVKAVTVSGPGSALSGFDGDGICSGDYGTWTGSSGCPYGPAGYEGPGTSFVTDPSLPDSAEVDVAGGLAPGKTAYFSLEGALTSAELTAREGPLKNLPDLVTVATATPQGRLFGKEYDKYQVTVNNSGNATATGTVLTITVPSDYLIGFTSSPHGDSCPVSRGAKFDGGTITCTLGSLAVGDTADVAVTLIPVAVGADPILAAATETETDENPADNDFSLSFGSCEVQTLATHIGALPGFVPIYHTFILYTAADGTQTGFRGGPAHGGPDYGDILVESAPYNSNFIDYTPGAPAATDLLGPGACGTDASFQATVTQINAAHIKYEPLGPNSNSVAFTMLANAKLPEDKPAFTIAPGWGELLK